MSDKRYELFRYVHPDGSSKDWAIQINGDGTFTKRWGKTGTRLTSKDFSMSHPDDVYREKRSKTNKGYHSLGMCFIDDDGNMSQFPPASLKPSGDNAHTVQDEQQIYWRLHRSPNTPALTEAIHLSSGFKDHAENIISALINAYPDCQWLRDYADKRFSNKNAGKLEKSDGVASLLLLMALKKVAPAGYTISLSHEDSVEISDQLKLESEALSFFGTDLESVRQIAEDIGLLMKRLDLSTIASELNDLYF